MADADKSEDHRAPANRSGATRMATRAHVIVDAEAYFDLMQQAMLKRAGSGSC